MSHTAHIPSHRKPRRSASKLALRAGVAGGVLGTIAVAGAAGPANAEPVTETIEMPTLGSLDGVTGIASAVAASAEASQQEALDQNLRSREDAALQTASKEAKKAKAEAERKAAAERAEKARLKAEQERKEAAERERASRDSVRTQLTSTSTSDDGGSSSSDGGSSASQGDSQTQAPSGSAAAIVAFARAQIGDAYVSGGTGPNSWDCSGLVQAAYKAAGIDLPRISYEQSSMGTSVSLSDLQPGDVLYWGSRSGSYHVAIYVGGGKYVGAQNPSSGVVEHTMDWDTPSGAVRIL
ncbi:C40 family peptidase [Streptomyces sp. SP18ES09]|uniref:C40 family peptidase n=1 Tax=Streptomyces sp. SP18ES09 TaxID=3002532 RepID=UPI002E76BA90|nr:C40 family peptidase [Streptomyces sp. SP18ES09]MEE1814937.1 C40 family peptidase [Streptomyces sp. SP18ES09]